MRKILALLNYSMYFCKKELLDMTEKEINKIVSENLQKNTDKERKSRW